MTATKNYAALSDPARNSQFGRNWTDPSHRKPAPAGASATAEIVAGVEYRQKIERVYALGARCFAELLAELGVEKAIMPIIHEKLELYGNIDPEALRLLDGDKFWPAPLHEVRRVS